MKFKTHPHRSDLLTLSKADLDKIANGEILTVGGMVIGLEKPDVVKTMCLAIQYDAIFVDNNQSANIKFTFDGETGKLKSAELL